MKDRALADTSVRLKEVDRAGWKRIGVTHPESVAAHSWGVALLALLRCPSGLDRHKLLAMAILHDLAEVEVGDLTPHDGVSKAEKRRREAAAMDRLLADRPDLRALWDEAEEGVSPEAKLLKTLDLAEMAVQAARYGELGYDVSEFIASAADAPRILED